VAHACNPGYSGGRNQEDQGWKPALANTLRPYLRKKITKKGVGVAQAVGPEFNPRFQEKKKERE
jgi:hypothetical protein